MGKMIQKTYTCRWITWIMAYMLFDNIVFYEWKRELCVDNQIKSAIEIYRFASCEHYLLDELFVKNKSSWKKFILIGVCRNYIRDKILVNRICFPPFRTTITNEDVWFGWSSSKKRSLFRFSLPRRRRRLSMGRAE